MSLEDNETGKLIINPYISIYDFEMDSWAAINAETFGRNAQTKLIHPCDEKTVSDFFKENKNLYRIVATVGKQDHPFGFNSKLPLERGVRVDGASDAVALIPLGYLLEEVIKEYFPNTFRYFQLQQMKGKNKT